mmetsp:Transcript_27538/g.42170  ORF Transcript_27538/g.42170 Transcript_27538/m.42170 type:complete len:87 (-) Transcript_27538:83-343(-)
MSLDESLLPLYVDDEYEDVYVCIGRRNEVFEEYIIEGEECECIDDDPMPKLSHNGKDAQKTSWTRRLMRRQLLLLLLFHFRFQQSS